MKDLCPPGWPRPKGYSNAMAARGRIVFTAGMVGTDPATGKLAGDDIQAQGRQTMENLKAALEAAGTSLDNVVRILQFHTDLAEFYPVYKVWERKLGGRPVPFSAIQVPSPLPVPGATVMIEAWAYAP